MTGLTVVKTAAPEAMEPEAIRPTAEAAELELEDRAVGALALAGTGERPTKGMGPSEEFK
jgi:hypothetical protein